MQYHGEEGATLQKCLIKNLVYFVNVQAQLTIQVFQKQDPEKIMFFHVDESLFLTVFSLGHIYHSV